MSISFKKLENFRPNRGAQILIGILGVLGVLSGAQGDEIAGGTFFNTGPFRCDGHPIYLSWANTNPYTMRFFAVRVFHGRDYGVIADYHTEVRHHGPDGSVMALFQQDAYDMGGHREQDTSYQGHYQTLAPGESMWLLTFCNQFQGNPGNGHTVVTMFWAGVQ